MAEPELLTFSQPAVAQKGRPDRQIVVFDLGKERYGVNIESVQEVVSAQEITPLPGTPAYVVGVTNLRGTVVPVVNLRQRLELPADGAGDQNCIMVVNLGGSMVGCVVDKVDEVRTVPLDAISPPVTIGYRSECVDGIARVADTLIILIDLECVIPSETRKLA